MSRGRLRPVPETPSRAVAYIRVSKERDEMISPELQATAISDHCARHGYVVVETLSDLDSTGRFWKRRQVERAVGMIESGDADVLVVWKVSRVARNRRDWAIAVDRVESAGGRLESATEPLDATTSTGRLARGMLAEFAAFESERIGDTWRETHSRRLKAGLPINGKARWGYVYADGRHSPDPTTGPVLADLYRRYIAGESVHALVRWLNAAGHRTAAGYTADGPGVWSDRTLRRMLDSGFGAGQLLVRGTYQPGAHDAVIDAGTWRSYLAARESRRVVASSERSVYVLSGLVRCHCGAAMTSSSKRGATPRLRCKAAKEQGRHTGGYVEMHIVEAAVLRWLQRHGSTLTTAAQTKLAQERRTRRVAADVKSLARDVAALDKQLAKLTRQYIADVIPEQAYIDSRDQLTAERATLHRQLLQAEADLGSAPSRLIARQLAEEWTTLPVEHRRTLLRKMIEYVEVGPAGPGDRVSVHPRFGAS